MRPREAVGGSARSQANGKTIPHADAEDHALLDRFLANPSTTDRRYFQKAYWRLIRLAEEDPDFVLGGHRRRFDYEPLRRAINRGVDLPDFDVFLRRWRGARQGSQRDLAWVELYLERSDVQAAIGEAQHLPQLALVPQVGPAGNGVRSGRRNSEPPKSRTRTGG